MASFITRFDIEKFDGKNDFGLWKIKMYALMVQQGCDAALETLPADMEARENVALMKKAYKGHLKRDCPMKKSSGVIKKGKRDQDYDSSDDEGNTYFGEALAVVGNDEMTELIIDSGGSYHMTHRRDFLYDFHVVDGGSVQLGDNRTCTIKGTAKVKIQFHDGSSFILKDVRYVPGLRRSLISLGTLEK
ncbi:hypothetical protein Tco_0340262 [Tanacetum coccineum]